VYNRKFYIDKLMAWKDKPLIKIITGLRRSGKSTLIKLYMEELTRQGVSAKRILYINKEDLQFEAIKTYAELYKEVRARRKKAKDKLYLFVDEVQEIEAWEKAVVSIHSEELADIYLTGSNARIFSAELATLPGGGCIQIPVFPLTFGEYLKFRKITVFIKKGLSIFSLNCK